MFKNKIAVMLSLLLSFAVTAEENVLPEKDILKVNAAADNGQNGTLRWALEKNNQNPGRYKIEIDFKDNAPLVIKPGKPLPEIKGPVDIINMNWLREGTYIAIDGSGYIKPVDPRSCPGAEKGQYGANVRTNTLPGLVLRDTHDVTIQGLEVRNFCIGILLNRASNNVIEDNRFVANHGGAGLMMTGDDGKGNSTATTTQRNKILRNTFLNNGDGMEATRGASFNLIADNLITTDASNQEPSQGLEMLWGNDNQVIHNTFQNYSDGVQINWGNRNYIAANMFKNLSSAVTLSGTDNIVAGNRMVNNRVAVAVRPQGVAGKDGHFGINRITGPNRDRISENIMIDNGKDIKRCFAGGSCLPDYAGAIVFNVPGLEHADFPGSRGGGISNNASTLERICALDGNSAGCEKTPNENQLPPVISQAAHQGNDLIVSGSVKGEANTLYRIEFFANSKANRDEAENFLGYDMVPVHADGQGTFKYMLPLTDDIVVANVTSTATTEDGATSPLSKPVTAK